MTKALALDVEATTHNKGNPYDSRNKLVCFSFATNEGANDSLMWNDLNKEILIEDSLPWADVVVGFNFKYDYHWFAKEGVDLSNKEIWDVQIAEFILSNQTHKIPIPQRNLPKVWCAIEAGCSSHRILGEGNSDR
jgi:hypothetical protein